LERARKLLELARVDKPHAIGDFLRAGDLEPLPALDGLDEVRGFEQRLVCAGIEPGESASERNRAELAALQIVVEHVGNVVLAARRWLQPRSDIRNASIEEVKPRHCISRAGLLGL